MLKKWIVVVMLGGLLIVGGAYYRNTQAAKQFKLEAEQQRQQELKSSEQQRIENETVTAKKRAQQQAEAEQKLRSERHATESLENKKTSVEQQAKNTVGMFLRDPGSAQFRNLSVALDAPISIVQASAPRGATADLVCGEVNAKNIHGGYVGFRWFYWDSHSKKLFANTIGQGGEHMDKAAYTACERIRSLAQR